jgi:aminotransferase
MRNSFIAQRAEDLKPSGIRKFFDIVLTMKGVVSLGIGEPDFTTPRHIVDACIKALEKGETHYTANAGLIELRKALSEHLDRLYGVKYDAASELILTAGGAEAIYLACNAILDPGDEIIIPTPCYVAYQAEVFLAGGVAVEVAGKMEENFDINAKDIEAKITPKTKALFICFPSNPSGAVASREQLLEVAKLVEKHNLVVISDEIYDRLTYGVDHVCFSSLPGMRERTILLGGFSKSYAMTGWRIGYAAGPADLIGVLNKIHAYTIQCAPAMAQWAALEALKNGEPAVEEMRKVYDRRRRLIVDGLNRIGLPTFEPKGAFYCFPKVSGTGLDEDTFANRLLMEEKVAVVPGTAFGAGGEGFVRCSYATSDENLKEALVRIERFVKSLK